MKMLFNVQVSFLKTERNLVEKILPINFLGEKKNPNTSFLSFFFVAS